MKSKPSRSWVFEPRFRITRGDRIALGPGKARLLRLVKETGSISGAARAMEMSYMRAWTLIRTMNNCFREPVVLTSRGGRHQGGASLTRTGDQLLRFYELLEAQALERTMETRLAIAKLLKRPQQ